MNLLASSPALLVEQLMPWLEDREARPLSRSNAVRVTRSPSMSPFWTSHQPLYRLLQGNFSRLSENLLRAPTIRSDVGLSKHLYCLNQAGLRSYRDGSWVFVRRFDALDLLVSFPLRATMLYFRIEITENPVSDTDE